MSSSFSSSTSTPDDDCSDSDEEIFTPISASENKVLLWGKILIPWDLLEMHDASVSRTWSLDETELLTVTLTNWMNCSHLINIYSMHLIKQSLGTYANQNSYRIVNANIVYWVNYKQGYKTTPTLLPLDIDRSNGILFIPMFLDYHCSLIVADFQTRELRHYDSLPGYHSKHTLNDYFTELRAVLHEMYCKNNEGCQDNPDCWEKGVRVAMPQIQQLSNNECGILTLKTLEVFLRGEDPVAEMSPEKVSEYRLEIITNLFSMSKKCQELIEKHGSQDNVIQLFQRRYRYRRQLGLYEKYREDINIAENRLLEAVHLRSKRCKFQRIEKIRAMHKKASQKLNKTWEKLDRAKKKGLF